jgi:PTH1 family peptidyl-tRNA hydrolase
MGQDPAAGIDRWLVAGLGNPGQEYSMTRHNAGFLLVDRLAECYGIDLPAASAAGRILWARGRLDATPVVLAKPLSYMNRSGPPLRRLAEELQIPVEAVMVVHDDVDLVFGRIKIKKKGGDGGHRGVMSLIDAFGRDDFVRLRIGVGRPPRGLTAVEYVLSRFTADEAPIFDAVLEKAREAVLTIVCEGVSTAMNRFNGKEGQINPVNS